MSVAEGHEQEHAVFKEWKEPREDGERGAGLGELGKGLTIQSFVGQGEKFGFYMKWLENLKLGSDTIWFPILKVLAGCQVMFQSPTAI